ncbi:MAG: NUDIX hydrolase [Sphingobium sp.]|nr:NUDIX hydrolase [Sphingobium sp.]
MGLAETSRRGRSAGSLPQRRQIAALPYATDADGSMRILLITSRDTRRWVIPKGNRIKGVAGHRAAEIEAFEEAGIHGIVCPTPLGRYRYDKKRRNGGVREATVEVFPLAVTGQLPHWPEQGERELCWFPVAEAAKAVDEPDLQSIIAAFREPPADPGWFFRIFLWLRDR